MATPSRWKVGGSWVVPSVLRGRHRASKRMTEKLGFRSGPSSHRDSMAGECMPATNFVEGSPNGDCPKKVGLLLQITSVTRAGEGGEGTRRPWTERYPCVSNRLCFRRNAFRGGRSGQAQRVIPAVSGQFRS